ncbi:hypothetical protein GCM10023189_45740 [Nibrella saemangeumensis]|uniref:Por secretion system C-terminal sorting domain-containing protein n=1 Tax=Nibrella saemangeumensis TaxID=1084526 RepID=A0ABP8NH27_9BACT
MKKFRIKVAVLIAAWSLASMGGALADDKKPGVSKVKVVKSEQKKFRLYTPEGESQASQSYYVTLMDPNGVLLYEGKVAKKGEAVTSFDLKNLPDGRYYLRASTDAWYMSQGLTIHNDNLSIDELDYNLLQKPTLESYDTNKFKVSFPSVSRDDVQLWILNRWDEEVYADIVSSERPHRFDLSRLPAGPYKIVVRLAQKDFVEPITIK